MSSQLWAAMAHLSSAPFNLNKEKTHLYRFHSFDEIMNVDGKTFCFLKNTGCWRQKLNVIWIQFCLH